MEQLPFGSYLALPMVGHSGAVCGGLFLSHPDADVFTAASKEVVAALAACAGIAIDNARLYEIDRRVRIAAEAADRVKDEFLAVLGHELRNPLSTVRNSIAIARMDPAHSDRALALAERGAEQLTRLTDDLLDIARITHGKIALCRATVSLAQIVERAIDSARHDLEARGQTIAVAPQSGSLRVDGDALRLEQVIGNLLSNASKYTDPGGHITVAMAQEDREVIVRVRDTGIGIAPEALPRVFDLFAQAPQVPDHAQGGLGIGLALVKRLVELHGGRVEAHSDGCGTGTELVVRLPAAPTTSASAAPQVSRTLAPCASARVLVVDDDPDATELTAKLLETRGHQVCTASDGPAALRAALADPPDVMFVDIGMRGMDGYQVAATVRQYDGLQHVSLVALTGYGRDEDRLQALAAGFDYHLAKPINREELLELVARLATQKPLSLAPSDGENSGVAENGSGVTETTPAARAALWLVGTPGSAGPPVDHETT